MAYSIRVDAERRVVLVVVRDPCEASGAEALITSARQAAAESGFGVLYDIRAAPQGDVQSTDVFWWPRSIPVLQDPAARRVRAAVLHGPQHRALVQFWETAFRNLGFPASAFEDEELALQWLSG
ncbi:MAG TPA: hypothetical protein VF386_07510 [Usitatibacter sp.]